MLDDDDLDFAILLEPGGPGCVGAVISILVVLVVWFFVQKNHEECSHRHCRPGQESVLMNHDCLCVEKATK